MRYCQHIASMMHYVDVTNTRQHRLNIEFSKTSCWQRIGVSFVHRYCRHQGDITVEYIWCTVGCFSRQVLRRNTVTILLSSSWLRYRPPLLVTTTPHLHAVYVTLCLVEHSMLYKGTHASSLTRTVQYFQFVRFSNSVCFTPNY